MTHGAWSRGHADARERSPGQYAPADAPVSGEREISLDDKYSLQEGSIYLSGVQALVRLPVAQSLRDEREGLDTAGFVSGYRGSPLAGLDQQFGRAHAHLDQRRIHFQPGVNEELAATAVWGSQQAELFAGAKHDGVFAMWYGKAPGVDRAGDIFQHGNAAATSRRGGVLLVAGDDHGCKSSTLPSCSVYAFVHAGIPVLNPADVQEVLDYGLYGWALSRFSGCWVAMIALADTMDTSASVDASLDRVRLVTPRGLESPPGGRNIRIWHSPLDQEKSLHAHRLPAAVAFCRANRLDRVMIERPRAKIGIVTTGKTYHDVREALGMLESEGAEPPDGVGVYKVGMVWPLESRGIRRFARGLDELIVVEEKHGVIEGQIRECLYGAPRSERPRIVGKRAEDAMTLFPAHGELTADTIAWKLADRFAQRSPRTVKGWARAAALPRRAERKRLPFFCPGCPHSTSTHLPEGSRGVGGIGCHFMVQWMNRRTDVVTQMGGEGANWIGNAPFTDEPHVFVNLGDGTYFHSGSLAIRAAIAAGVNCTYKILFNGAVAMTGGQELDGELSVARLTQQLAAEGVSRIAVVADQPAKYGKSPGFAAGSSLYARDELDAVQQELRGTPGCTVLIYDQSCAAETRRRRKRGVEPDPRLGVVINEAVCEGCGDCSQLAGCLAIEPIDTPLGSKRRVNASACNKDLTCVDACCPAFVSVRGGRRRRLDACDAPTERRLRSVPPPEPPPLEGAYNILIPGIGGTGVITVSSLLGMAAHIEGKQVSVLDMTGLAQKGGAVVSHVRIASAGRVLHSRRIPAGTVDVLLACDLIAAAEPDALALLSETRTRSVVNGNLSPTAAFVLDPSVEYEPSGQISAIRAGSAEAQVVAAADVTAKLFGDSITANVFVLGYALQRGWIPLRAASLKRAIELNGAAVSDNLRALAWGRGAAHDSKMLLNVSAGGAEMPGPVGGETRSELVDARCRDLRAYQDARYAQRYRNLVERVGRVEARLAGEPGALTEAVALYYFKLLAYKDEYEVSRLFTDGRFLESLRADFEGKFRLEFHLAPPLFSRPDPATGRPRGRRYGRWMLRAMSVLARFKGLRGTPLDPFGYTRERRLERCLISEYEQTVEALLDNLEPENRAIAVAVASLPGEIRGFGPVKERAAQAAQEKHKALMAEFLGS